LGARMAYPLHRAPMFFIHMVQPGLFSHIERVGLRTVLDNTGLG
jgi:hypothetical protein